jgi:LDH2 family malate/lactate/ureidoglycolate dehydrogenase
MAVDMRRFSAASVRAQIEAVLRAWGMDEAKLQATAEIMLETDLRGIDSHGISMLIMYDQMQAAGQLRLQAEPRILRETATTALVDGGAGLGHPVALMAMDLAIAKARAHDVGVVSVRNSHHFGAAGCYAERAPAAGLIGIVSTTSRTVNVVPTLGAERVLGTNPLCFAAPAGRNPPFLLDMSTSVVAANKVKVYALQEKPLPVGWVTDGAGRPVTDAVFAYDLLFQDGEGGLTPVGGIGTATGGHKGYGLGIVAQLLSSTLGGGAFSPLRNQQQKPGDPDNIGHFFLALNPAAFRAPGEFETDLDEVLDTLRRTCPADPAHPVLIPGDPERASRAERLEQGIPMPESLVEKIEEIAARAGAERVLEVVGG